MSYFWCMIFEPSLELFIYKSGPKIKVKDDLSIDISTCYMKCLINCMDRCSTYHSYGQRYSDLHKNETILILISLKRYFFAS